jgi:hypothetical protein
MQTRPARNLAYAMLALGAAALAGLAAVSLRWRYAHDSPLMLYVAYLMNAFGAVPYRDVFDMNLPGTYFVLAWFGRLFGYSDAAFRLLDLAWMLLLAWCTYGWLRRFGRPAALAGALLPALHYLLTGPTMSLQREQIALLPFAAAVAIAMRPPGGRPAARGFAIGLLTAAAALVKPQFVFLGLPVALSALLDSRPATRSAAVVPLAAGFALPVLLCVAGLAAAGGLRPFLEIAHRYWPLYTHLTGAHAPVGGLDRFLYLIHRTALGLWSLYTPVALFGLMMLVPDRSARREAFLLGAVAACAALYPALAGQFWPYHWLPLRHTALALSGLCLLPLARGRRRAYGVFPILLAALLLLLASAQALLMANAQLRNPDEYRVVKHGVPDRVAAFLRSNLRPGDTVQPLDWTGGAVHGMLMAGARLGTSFLYDFHFYHHAGHPYIAALRARFLREMEERRPRFVVEVLQDKPWPTGEGSTQEFPELRALLERDYEVAEDDPYCRIHARRTPAASAP